MLHNNKIMIKILWSLLQKTKLNMINVSLKKQINDECFMLFSSIKDIFFWSKKNIYKYFAQKFLISSTPV